MKYLYTIIAIGIFAFFSVAWILRNYFIDMNENFLWPFTFYMLMALYGGVLGIRISLYWGGIKSAIGMSVLLFSLGLLGQVFGQIYYTIAYDFLNQEVPYPFGEIGFLSSVTLYAVGAFFMAKISGSKLRLKNVLGIIVVITVPIIMYTFSFFSFIYGREFNLSLSTILDTDSIFTLLSIIYPLIHATFVSLALIAYILSYKVLGGKLKYAVVSILFALFVHYLAESLYLYQDQHEIFVAGGIADLAYLFAYFVMTLALIQFKTVLSKIK